MSQTEPDARELCFPDPARWDNAGYCLLRARESRPQAFDLLHLIHAICHALFSCEGAGCETVVSLSGDGKTLALGPVAEAPTSLVAQVRIYRLVAEGNSITPRWESNGIIHGNECYTAEPNGSNRRKRLQEDLCHVLGHPNNSQATARVGCCCCCGGIPPFQIRQNFTNVIKRPLGMGHNGSQGGIVVPIGLPGRGHPFKGEQNACHESVDTDAMIIPWSRSL